MALTVAQVFTEFAEKLKPTAAQEDMIAARRQSVENFRAARILFSSKPRLSAFTDAR
jgi:hypothetical protein